MRVHATCMHAHVTCMRAHVTCMRVHHLRAAGHIAGRNVSSVTGHKVLQVHPRPGSHLAPAQPNVSCHRERRQLLAPDVSGLCPQDEE